MYLQYPTPRGIIRIVLPALLVAQFIVWPVTGLVNPHLGIAATELTLLWFIALYVRRNRLVSEDLLLLNATPISTMLLVVPTALAGSLLVGELDLHVSALLRQFDWPTPTGLQRSIIEIQLVRSLLDLPKIGFSVVFLPGVCEELFFRGFVLTGMYVHLGTKRAIFISAALFALAHFNPWQFPALFAMGLLFAVLVYWTHSIYPAILAHCANNAFSVTGINLRTHYGLDGLASGEPLSAVAILLSALVLCGGLWAISRGERVMPLAAGEEDPYVPRRHTANK